MSQEPRMDDNKNLVSTFLYRQGPSVVLYPRNASANVRRKLYIINNRWRRAPPWWEIVMGPVLECVLEKKGRKRDDSSLRRKYHHLLVQNPMTITMDDLFRSKLPPKEAKLLCVCVCVGVCLHNVERREEKRWRTHRGSRRHHATRRNPEGRGFVWTTTSHHLLTHSRQNRPRFLQETFLKEKKNKEKSCWRFNRFANEDEHSWLGNMYTYSINGRLMPRQQLIMQIPPQVPYVNFPPFFFLPFSNSGWTKSNYKRRYSKISDSRLTSSDTISIDWALFNVFRGSQSDLVRGGGIR